MRNLVKNKVRERRERRKEGRGKEREGRWEEGNQAHFCNQSIWEAEAEECGHK